MVICPECESDLDVEEDEVDEGEIVSCPECGSDFEVVAVEPLELTRVAEEKEEEDEEAEEEESDSAEGSRSRARYASALISLLLAAPVAFAGNPLPPQSSQTAKKDYALIYGTVWGPDDHPVAGVPIKIRRVSDKKAKWDLVSDRNGEFAQRVPVGKQDYIIQADIKASKGQPKPETTVHIDDNERQDVGIHLTKETLPPK